MIAAQPLVWICQLAREWEFWTWLCARCVAARQLVGWQVRVRKLPPPRTLVTDGVTCAAAIDDRTALRCDDCPRVAA